MKKKLKEKMGKAKHQYQKKNISHKQQQYQFQIFCSAREKNQLHNILNKGI